MTDSFQLDDEGSGVFEIFRYDFDAPEPTDLAGGSLGNAIETIIGPGDSGGPALRRTADGWEIAASTRLPRAMADVSVIPAAAC